MLRFSELREREVVHIQDGKRLGYVEDMVIDQDLGTIVALIAPGKGKWMGLLASEEEYTIPWQRIVKIGDDLILVDGLDSRAGRRYDRQNPRLRTHESYDRERRESEEGEDPLV